MNATLKSVAMVCGMAFTSYAAAQITFFEQDNFGGRTFTAVQQVRSLDLFGFNDRASSMVVVGGRWEVCDDVRFGGRCTVLRPGRYATLTRAGLNDRVSSARPLARSARVDANRYAPEPAIPAQVVFYQDEGFRGPSFTAQESVLDFRRVGFNDRASSAVVMGERWEVCDDARFGGRCVVLRPGRYPSLSAMGMSDRISSVRDMAQEAQINSDRYAPQTAPVYDNRRRPNEQLYQANVRSVRAVVGPPEQRCWIEKEQLTQPRSNANVGGAIAGALIGGILGHQVGGGTGKELATAGGAVAGAVVGAKVAGNNAAPQVQTRDVQRCNTEPNQNTPEYWDVSYEFRGQMHTIQMTAAPGATVTVNAQGEPRS